MKKQLSLQMKLGILIILALLFISIFAGIISPHDPYKLGIPYQRPSPAHLLGTNDIGQDILSELIYGARVSLVIGLVSAFVITFLGTALGMSAGYFGGKTDRIITQVINVAMSVPSLPITIILVAFLEASIWNIVIAICATAWASTARIVRTRTQQICALPFITIEKTLGAGHVRIMFRHILPNLAEIVFIRGVLSISGAMLSEASLSFLGLGVIGQKSWGGILHYAFFRNGIINRYYWWYLPPIICISVSVLGFMLLGYQSGGGKSSGKSRNIDPDGGAGNA